MGGEYFLGHAVYVECGKLKLVDVLIALLLYDDILPFAIFRKYVSFKQKLLLLLNPHRYTGRRQIIPKSYTKN